jgi:hypothetical protein
MQLKTDTQTVAAGTPIYLEIVDAPANFNPILTTWYAEGLGEFQPVSGEEMEVFKDEDGNELAASLGTFQAVWRTAQVSPGAHNISAYVFSKKDFANVIAAAPSVPKTIADWISIYSTKVKATHQLSATVTVTRPTKDVQPITMRRAEVPPTADQALWTVIRNSTTALSFKNYSDFMEVVLCGEPAGANASKISKVGGPINNRLRLPFPDVEAYRQLKVATEVFMMMNCGVLGAELARVRFGALDSEALDDEGRRYYRAVGPGDIERYWRQYLERVSTGTNGKVSTLPYLAIIRRKLKDVAVTHPTKSVILQDEAAVACLGIAMEKLTRPCLLELIWSYWHEEGMLVQTLNALTWRFQNRRGPADRDPLAMLEIDPLRPLNNFIWGYIQDEQHRLTVPRRAYEYDHHYGLTLLGKAVPEVRGVDSRVRFLEAFHQLLYVCVGFYKEDDDTTVVADGFPVLNALKEVHLLLTQGAHNQYGDLPWTARQEMLMQQWLLARPEMREFLPSRIMVDYPEEWMDRVETMKTMQGWTDTSILHFHDLGVFGENILLGIRFGAWPGVIEPEQAANWARYWRPEVQGYVHAYRAATGVDLTEGVDATLPALLLRHRLSPQQGQTRLLSPQAQARVTLQQAASRLLPGSRQASRTPVR